MSCKEYNDHQAERRNEIEATARGPGELRFNLVTIMLAFPKLAKVLFWLMTSLEKDVLGHLFLHQKFRVCSIEVWSVVLA